MENLLQKYEKDDANVTAEVDEWRMMMKRAQMMLKDDERDAENTKGEDKGTEGCIKLLDEMYEDIYTIMKKLHVRFMLMTDNHPILEENDGDDDFGNEDMRFMINETTKEEEASSRSSSSSSTTASKSSNSKISLSLTSLDYCSPSGKKMIEQRTSPLQRVRSVATSPSISTTSFKDNKEVTVLCEDKKFQKGPRFENTIKSTVLFFQHKHKGSHSASYSGYLSSQKKKKKKRKKKRCRDVSIAPCQLQDLFNKIYELKNNISAVEAAQQIGSSDKKQSTAKNMSRETHKNIITDTSEAKKALINCMNKFEKLKKFLDEKDTRYKILDEKMVGCCTKKDSYLHGYLDEMPPPLKLRGMETSSKELENSPLTNDPTVSSIAIYKVSSEMDLRTQMNTTTIPELTTSSITSIEKYNELNRHSQDNQEYNASEEKLVEVDESQSSSIILKEEEDETEFTQTIDNEDHSLKNDPEKVHRELHEDDEYEARKSLPQVDWEEGDMTLVNAEESDEDVESLERTSETLGQNDTRIPVGEMWYGKSPQVILEDEPRPTKTFASENTGRRKNTMTE